MNIYALVLKKIVLLKVNRVQIFLYFNSQLKFYFIKHAFLVFSTTEK